MKSESSVPLFAHCPYCFLPYTSETGRTVDMHGKRRIVHVKCEHCEHAMLVSVQYRHNGLVCAGIFTDCEFEDAKRFLSADKISVDDVIDVHNALKFDNFLKMR